MIFSEFWAVSFHSFPYISDFYGYPTRHFEWCQTFFWQILLGYLGKFHSIEKCDLIKKAFYFNNSLSIKIFSFWQLNNNLGFIWSNWAGIQNQSKKLRNHSKWWKKFDRFATFGVRPILRVNKSKHFHVKVISMQMKWMRKRTYCNGGELNSLQWCIETKIILFLILFHCNYLFS